MSEIDHCEPFRAQRARHSHGVYPGYEELVRAAEAAVGRYSPTEAIDMADETGVLFIDVRDAVELSDGMVSGAIHASRGRLEAHLDPDNARYVSELNDAAQLVFYCASGARSALAARRALEMGYDRVRHLDGGFSAWTDVGGQTQPFGHRW